MEFDWIEPAFDTRKVSPREIEEAFEDPFSLRFLPDAGYGEEDARYVSLGKTVANRPLFCVFWTDGKLIRVIACREMTDDESNFYHRKNAENLA